MQLMGIVCLLGGWAVAVGGLFVTPSTAGRTIIACLGIALSLFGSLGILNGYYLERAIWKK